MSANVMTPDRRAIFATMYAADATWMAMEEAIGVTVNGLRKYRRRAGIAVRIKDDNSASVWTPKRDAELIRLRANHLPSVIARMLGKSLDTITGRLKKLIVTIPKVVAVAIVSPVNAERQLAGVDPLPAFHPIASSVLFG